jgi:hypothetical protein
MEIATACGLAMTFWVPDNDIPGSSLRYEGHKGSGVRERGSGGQKTALKSEYRNPKLETNSNNRNTKFKTKQTRISRIDIDTN